MHCSLFGIVIKLFRWSPLFERLGRALQNDRKMKGRLKQYGR